MLHRPRYADRSLAKNNAGALMTAKLGPLAAPDPGSYDEVVPHP